MLGLPAPDSGDGDTRGKNEGPWGGVGEKNRERTGGRVGSWALASLRDQKGKWNNGQRRSNQMEELKPECFRDRLST